MPSRDEEVVGHTESTMPFPIVGEIVSVMGHQWRCVSVAYEEVGPELRVRFRQIGGAGEQNQDQLRRG